LLFFSIIKLNTSEPREAISQAGVPKEEIDREIKLKNIANMSHESIESSEEKEEV